MLQCLIALWPLLAPTEENTCNRGGYCNFMHLKPIGKDLRKKLFGRYKNRSRSRSREKCDEQRLSAMCCLARPC